MGIEWEVERFACLRLTVDAMAQSKRDVAWEMGMGGGEQGNEWG